MDNHRHLVVLGGQYHRHGHKTALGEYHVRFVAFYKLHRLSVAFQHPERIGEVFYIKIAAELS